jgi:hypothetical protein
MNAKKLPKHVKLFIVQAVACFDSPATVAEAVNQEFGIEIPRQQVEKYDPTKRGGAGLSEKYKAIFETTRQQFVKSTVAIGWSHRPARLRSIQRIGETAEATGDLALALQAVEQAAKEMGGLYTNQRILELEGKPKPADVDVLSPERRFPQDRLAHLREVYGGALKAIEQQKQKAKAT